MATNVTKRKEAAERELDVSKAKLVRRGPKNPLGPRLPLRAVREAAGRTQAEVAAEGSMDQGDVSRLEARSDVKISTLRRYVAALGGEIDLVVTLKTGHRFRVDLGEG